MSITLPSELSRQIEEKIALGPYATPEEMVEAALAALEDREVREAIAEGYEDAIAGRCRPWVEADAEFIGQMIPQKEQN